MAWYPDAIAKPIPPGSKDPVIIPVGLIYHVRDGLGVSLFDYFDGRSGGIESHWYIRFDGTIEQYRDTLREADANLVGIAILAYSGPPRRGDRNMDATSEEVYRPVTRGMRIMLLAASVLVFVIGIPLVLLTTQTETYFAWTIGSSLTAAFLGGAYWSSGVLELMASRETAWANARIAVPAVLLFTVLTLVATLVHRENFHFDAPTWHTVAGTWVWLLVYAVVPLIMGGLLLRQRTLAGGDPPRRFPLHTWVRVVLGVHAAIMLPIGVGLFLVPVTVAPIWPWGLTALTGQAIGAWVVSIGVIAAHAVYENDWSRLRSFAASYALLALLQLIALLRHGGEIDWTAPAGWFYLLFLLSVGAVGFSGLLPKARQSDALNDS